MAADLASPFSWSARFRPAPARRAAPSHPVALVLVLLPALVLPMRRARPRLALAACVALYLGALVLGTQSPGATLAMIVAAYTVAQRTARRRSVPAILAAVVATAATSIAVSLVSGVDTRFLQVGLALALAGAIGDAARSRRAYVEAVEERARRAEETREAEARRRVTEERLRIARDLHDAVAHRISVISLNAGVASSALETRPEKARDALATIRTTSRDVLGEIGAMLSVLRAPDEAAARSSPGWHVFPRWSSRCGWRDGTSWCATRSGRMPRAAASRSESASWPTASCRRDSRTR